VTIAHQTVVDEDRKPSAAIIPWDVFVEIQDALSGENSSSGEIEAMREAERDRREGKPGAFESHADLKARLGIP
jgi:hypothetical protein